MCIVHHSFTTTFVKRTTNYELSRTFKNFAFFAFVHFRTFVIFVLLCTFALLYFLPFAFFFFTFTFVYFFCLFPLELIPLYILCCKLCVLSVENFVCCVYSCRLLGSCLGRIVSRRCSDRTSVCRLPT